jgi:hypothetical protein
MLKVRNAQASGQLDVEAAVPAADRLNCGRHVRHYILSRHQRRYAAIHPIPETIFRVRRRAIL